MLTYEEMVALSDLYSTMDGGVWRVNVVGLRAELIHNWAFSELQAQQVIWDMKDRGLIPG